MKSLLVMKHGCTAVNLREKHRTQHRCPKEETHLKLQKEIDLRRHCTRYSSTQAESCYKNHVNRGTASPGNTAKSMCLLMSTIFPRESSRTLACVASNFFMIAHLHTSTSSCLQEYLAEENTETLSHPPYPLTLRLENCLAGPRFKSRSSLGSAILHCLSHGFKRAFLRWVERLRNFIAANEEHFEKLQRKKDVCGEESTL